MYKCVCTYISVQVRICVSVCARVHLQIDVCNVFP